MRVASVVAGIGIVAVLAAGCARGGGTPEGTEGGGEASPGITDDSITLGITTPLSGPTAGPGTCTGAGITAWKDVETAETAGAMGIAWAAMAVDGLTKKAAKAVNSAAALRVRSRSNIHFPDTCGQPIPRMPSASPIAARLACRGNVPAATLPLSQCGRSGLCDAASQ